MSHHCEHHQGQDCDCEGKCKDGGCECSGGSCHCGKGCCEGSHFQRRYKTKAEQIVELDAYLGELKLEVQAGEEMLVDLVK